MTKRASIATLALIVLTALLIPACSLFDDDDDSSSNPAASLAVYGTDAPGDVTSLVVELTGVRIFSDSSDLEGVPLPPEGALSEVDLVAAANSGVPGLFGEFTIPAGSYRCAEGTLSLESFTVLDESDQPVVCDSATNMAASFSTSRLCLGGSRAVIVGESGELDVVFDLPVLSGSVDPATGACTLELDLAGRRLMRLADM
jgi:hypothetical protein